jgi:Zn ribbon nucleic-acid-binding protein
MKSFYNKYRILANLYVEVFHAPRYHDDRTSPRRLKMKQEEKKELVEPTCSCGGYIAQKLNKEKRYPYQCVKCGMEYQTLPPAIDNNIFSFFKNFFFGKISE